MIKLDDLIGKPYKHNGRGPDFYDCWGLCLEVAKRLGRELPEYDTPVIEDERNALAIKTKDSLFEKLEKPEPWCLVVFQIFDDAGKEKWHVGTVLENCLRFIHITGKTLICTSSLNQPHWKLFFEGYYRYAG